MKKLTTLSAAIVLGMSMAGASYAGHPETPPAPQPTHLGFYAGAGGAFSSMTADSDFIANPVQNITAFHRSDTENSFAPLLQLGYWANWANNWVWGAKLMYQYHGDKADMFTSYALARIQHELDGLFTIGKQFHHGLAYLGAGPALLPTKVFGENGLFTANFRVPASSTQSKNLWGASVQGGISYFLTNTLFLDFSYTFTQTMSKQFDAPISTQAGGTASEDVSISSQTLALSLNAIL